MKIRKSTVEDITVMMHLYQCAKSIMRADGNMEQWAGAYPDEAAAEGDIARGNSYIVEDGGKPVGTFAFIPGVEPTYLRIEGGEWLDDKSPYATIHRIASTAESHGVAMACFEWCWEQCPNLRIDTHRDNRIMQHVIARFGFEYCGIIYLADGAERLAYQKIKK